MKFKNPVIPGFYPDPSVCRVGEDYYLVNSSFEFFPGVPLYHSKDLVNWEQIGHVLTRKSQLPLEGCRNSGGIFAPTIRYYQGRFYMVTTNVSGGGNFFVWTDDIHGEWSDPVWIKQDQLGIDPSLFWDDDGKVYFQGTFFDRESGRQCIGQSQIDLTTGEMLTETRPIWSGTGGKCPEGPHLYKINGSYYLMIAEGGTEYGHMETIARSDNVWGPFESCSHNPIVTQRDYSPSFADFAGRTPDVIHGVGHADLIDDPEGNWWLMFHGFRPSVSMLHHIGRETMVAPVTWDADGWPVVNGGKPIHTEMELPGNEGWMTQNTFDFAEDFTKEEKLPVRWAYLRNPIEENYRLENGLVLTAGKDELESGGAPTFLGVRQRQLKSTAETELEFAPTTEKQEAGLTVYHTDEHHYDLVVTRRNGKRVVLLRKRVCDLLTESEPVELPESGKLVLKVEADRMQYHFFAGGTEGKLLPVGEGRTQLLSTEMMMGTFTGCFFGMFTQGEGSEVKYTRFTCENTL
ncbi:MAG: glycoside hydrolase family 43 protein [Acutalibacter sp.]|nr:glycoside hydrolase family 43 protein [Acutalibacter sp.]